LEPLLTHKAVDDGHNVTLSCNYKSSYTDNYLHWYRQHPKSKPEFLLFIYDTTGLKSDSISPLLDVKVDKKNNKRVDLIISSAAVSDSALYYCALAPTV
ncbi:hypothetical protein C0J45_5589, partial [Silurus meridionalis]